MLKATTNSANSTKLTTEQLTLIRAINLYHLQTKKDINKITADETILVNGKEIALGREIREIKAKKNKLDEHFKNVLEQRGLDLTSHGLSINGKRTKLWVMKDKKYLCNSKGETLMPRTEVNFFDILAEVVKKKAIPDWRSTSVVEINGEEFQLGRVMTKYKKASNDGKLSSELKSAFELFGIAIDKFADGNAYISPDVREIVAMLKDIFGLNCIKTEYRAKMQGLSVDVMATFSTPFGAFTQLAVEYDGASHWMPSKIVELMQKSGKDIEDVENYVANKRKLELRKDSILEERAIPLIRARSVAEFKEEIQLFIQHPENYLSEHNSKPEYYVSEAELVAEIKVRFNQKKEMDDADKAFMEKHNIPGRH